MGQSDPVVMAQLGGPRDRATLLDVHARRLPQRWWLVITDKRTNEPLGTIGVWEIEHGGATLHETGWMPVAHGRGVATAALHDLLVRVRAEPAITSLHAVPAVTNVASNRLCDRFGFTTAA